MIRTQASRVPPSKRQQIDYKKRQFATPTWQIAEYGHRLSFYILPPTEEITLEDFELWGLARLKVLAELESCNHRNFTSEETASRMKEILKKQLPLNANSSRSSILSQERRKDHYSHYILRLAFSSTADLRKRFARLETQLFKIRYDDSDRRERQEFIDSLDMDWETVKGNELQEGGLKEKLLAASGRIKEGDEEGWFKVEWEKVPELVESRRVFLKMGKAYVPKKEQLSLVVAEFTRRLEEALELTARALPRLDESSRLGPILNHLATNFTAPDSTYNDAEALPGSLNPTAANVSSLAQHFPLCMSSLQNTLQTTHHLKHYGRLQYTLFLKGIGLSLDECIAFWRKSFSLMTDEKFVKEYKYNIRHAYGDVGGDANRRGRGYTPYSCQKLLTEPLPGPGQQHGCPYRTFSVDNLLSLLQASGIRERDVIQGVKDDVEKHRYHIACNRVFEHAHKSEIKVAKERYGWGAAELDTLLHPNAYFKRSWMLKHLDDANVKVEVKGEDE